MERPLDISSYFQEAEITLAGVAIETALKEAQNGQYRKAERWLNLALFSGAVTSSWENGKIHVSNLELDSPSRLDAEEELKNVLLANPQLNGILYAKRVKFATRILQIHSLTYAHVIKERIRLAGERPGYGQDDLELAEQLADEAKEQGLEIPAFNFRQIREAVKHQWEQRVSNSEYLGRSSYFGLCLGGEAITLFKDLGITSEPLKLKGGEQEIARQIGESVKYLRAAGNKPFIVGFPHYLMAYSISPKTTAIYFDNHADDGIDFKPTQKFTSGTFQLFAAAEQHIVLGATAQQFGRKAKVFSPDKIEKVLQEPLTRRLFLSIDLDVLGPKYYQVGPWTQGTLSPRDVSLLVVELVKDHHIVGLNIASYTESVAAKKVVKEILSPLFPSAE